MDEYITITEASKLTGKSITRIYKSIKRDRIQHRIIKNKYDIVKTVLKPDTLNLHMEEDTELFNKKIDNIKLSKEEQVLYRLGRIEQEILYLKAKVEILLQDTEQYNVLSDSADMQNITLVLQKEKEDLSIVFEIIQIYTDDYLQQANTLNNVILKEQETILEEKNRLIKVLEEYHKIKLKLKEAEREKNIKEFLSKKVSKASIARIIGVSYTALCSFIKSRKLV